MMTLFPWLAWLAATSSCVLLAIRWSTDDATPRARLIVLSAWFLLAACLQFAGSSDSAVATGLALQTVLAVLLIIWWKVEA